MKPAEPQIQQKAETQSLTPTPLDNQPVHRKLVGHVKVQCQWADKALTENESTHNRQCGHTSNTEMPLKVKSMQLDTNNHQTSDWTNREICTVSRAPGDKFDYLH